MRTEKEFSIDDTGGIPLEEVEKKFGREFKEKFKVELTSELRRTLSMEYGFRDKKSLLQSLRFTF